MFKVIMIVTEVGILIIKSLDCWISNVYIFKSLFVSVMYNSE